MAENNSTFNIPNSTLASANSNSSFFERVSSRASHVPDVLSCIANLSNDEVFTPPEVVNKMLDLLPQELFANPETTFLDPATKTGVFLREIAKRCLAAQLPGYSERSEEIAEKNALGVPLDEYDIAFQEQLQKTIDRIFHKQLYGIGITELTSLLARRSLYCSKYPNGPYSITHFDDAEGNIRFRRTEHVWGKATYDKDGNSHQSCVWCGASRGQYDRDKELETHAYEFIHVKNPEDIFKMKFDVIISNPPYQLTTNSEDRVAAKQARPIFQSFVEMAKKLNPRFITMIIPARWYSGGIGLQDFREDMVHDKHITKLVDYVNSRDCFTGVDIAGGICYFLWEKDRVTECEVTNYSENKSITTNRPLDEYGDIFIRSNESMKIIHKVKKKHMSTLDNMVFSLDPFGFPTSARGSEGFFEGAITLVHSKGIGYVRRNEILKNKDLVDKWKVTIARIVPCNGEVGIDPSKGYKAITTPRVLAPGVVNTFSYMLLGVFDSENEAKNFQTYMMCKFTRFLLRLTYSSMNIAKSNFMFVPKVDFSRHWTDSELYEYFELSEEDIGLIESTIRPMDLSGGDSD